MAPLPIAPGEAGAFQEAAAEAAGGEGDGGLCDTGRVAVARRCADAEAETGTNEEWHVRAAGCDGESDHDRAGDDGATRGRVTAGADGTADGAHCGLAHVVHRLRRD